MALVKRPAKRVAPKTLEKMKKARIEKEQEEIANSWIKAKEKRINQIEDQRKHLLSQIGYDNPYRGAMQVKYKTAAKTEATLKARGGKVSEGTIMGEKRYKELLERNNKILSKRTKDYEESKLFLSYSKQRHTLSVAGMDSFIETYDKVVDYIRKRHINGKMDYNSALNLLNQIESITTLAAKQANMLGRIRASKDLELHSRVMSKILVDFIKKRDYSETIRIMNAVSKDIKERRGIAVQLLELERLLK